MGAFDKFTGKKNYVEAKNKYTEISTEYNDAKKEYESKTEKLEKELFDCVTRINLQKEYIQTELLRDLVEMLSLLKDIEIPDEFCEEQYKRQCRKLDSFQKIKTRESLLTIDFDGKKWKTRFQSFITLGFYTRKKAKKSLENVNEEHEVLKNEMEEMKCEIAKLEVLVKSAKQIEYYFEKMGALFRKWLRYMEHAVHYIAYVAMRMSRKVQKRSISIMLLHEKQQKELEATINLAKVLSKMIQFQIMIGEKDSNLEEYEKKMKHHYQDFAKDEAA